MSLRPDQVDFVARIRGAFADGARTVCGQGATGFGKTHVAAEGIIAPAVARGRKLLFLAHLDTIITDTHKRLTSCGVRAGIIQADRPIDPEAPVQVASLQTLHLRNERPHADGVLLDECHRAMAASVREILAAYPHAWLLGLTATPQRGDGQPLGDVFEQLVCGPSTRWLTDNGHLAPCDVVAPAAFSDDGLVDDPVRAYERHAPGTRAIVFAANRGHAEELAAGYSAAGYPAATILGDTPRDERERLRAAVHDGSVRVLVGVGVFIEAFDLPAIETVILARSFTVTGAFLQAIGRGLRPSPSTGKTRCTVIDLRGSVHLHGLTDDERVWSLDGDAVRRKDVVTPLRRCSECLAIFRPSRCCPRCGSVATTAPKIPRVLTRAEKLVRWNAVPAAQRDARYLARLVAVATTRMRMPSHRAEQWAHRQFIKRFGRAPEGVAA